MDAREFIGIKDIQRDYGLGRDLATIFVKRSGKMLPRNGRQGATIKIQRCDFEAYLETQKGLGR